MTKQLNINLLTTVFLLLFFQSSGMAQVDSRDYIEIRKKLFQQQEDWNKGDIDAFMTAYWKSDKLQFGGANGITKGWQQTLENYKRGYPDQATMGKLTFQVKDISKHSRKVISLTGSWELERETDRPGGHFLLIWRKVKGEWKIVVDHTSQRNQPDTGRR